MGQSFQDSKRYASLYASPEGPGDGRPTALQIVKDNDMIDKLSGKTVLLTGGSNGSESRAAVASSRHQG